MEVGEGGLGLARKEVPGSLVPCPLSLADPGRPCFFFDFLFFPSFLWGTAVDVKMN
jgi:hypothetical protein